MVESASSRKDGKVVAIVAALAQDIGLALTFPKPSSA